MKYIGIRVSLSKFRILLRGGFMFNSFFNKFRKNINEKQAINKVIEEEGVKFIKQNKTIIAEVEEVNIKSEANNDLKISNNLSSIEKFYISIFNGNKNLIDIIKLYIDNTDSSELYNELRLRYLGEYFFNLGITKDEWDIGQVGNYLTEFMSTDVKVECYCFL